MPVGAGVLAQFIGEMGRDKIGFLREKWWGEPGALVLGSVLMLRRKPNVAFALAGAAGYAGGFNYKLSQFQQGKRAASPVPVFTSGAPAPVAQLTAAAAKQAGYYDEAGAIEDAVGF